MRIEIVISAAAHTALLVASAVALPSAEAYKIDEPPPLPVEIFTLDEFTQLAAKKTEIEPEKNALAKPEAVEPPEPVEEPPREVEAEKPPQQVAALEPEPAPVAVDVAEPIPLPFLEQATPPAPEPEPAPEPIAAPEPAPLPEPEPVQPPEPEIVETQPPPPVAAAPAPRRKPKVPKSAQKKPEKKVVKKKKPEFNPDKIAALLNKVQDDTGGPSPTPPAGRVEDGRNDLSGLDLVVTQSEMRYLQTQMQRCWNPPVGVANAADLNVRVEVRFSQNGELSGLPVVLNTGGEGFDVASNAAVRAVQQCQPYDMPVEKYDNWRQVIVNFDPKFMLGG